MPLQTGTWTLNSGGFSSPLTITGVDPSGVVTGSFPGGIAISGFWDENSARITFADRAQVYTGFLFQDQFRMPGITGAVVFTLTGFIETPSPAGGSAARSVYGWYAQIGVP
jgi:hypothetical protein